jgi:hypothetical protein
MKFLKMFVLVIVFLVSACTPYNKDVTSDYSLPLELKVKNCNIYIISNSYSEMKVMVCEKLDCTSTTHRAGKYTHNNAICL